jgi:thiol-disulfide isomerase/thioredoxin
MKKNVIIVICTILIITAVLIIKNSSTSALSFKKEYENLNNKKTSNGQTYIEVNISKENPIVYAGYNQIFKILNSTGVIYFGYPECQACRNAIPILLEAAKETTISKIYYLNNKDDEDIKTFTNGKIFTEKEGSENYQKLLEKVKNNADIYDGLNDNSVKRIYYPTVITVKNGKIISYISKTVDSQTDYNIPLNDDQKKELKNKYVDAINKILTCSKNEKC